MSNVVQQICLPPFFSFAILVHCTFIKSPLGCLTGAELAKHEQGLSAGLIRNTVQRRLRIICWWWSILHYLFYKTIIYSHLSCYFELYTERAHDFCFFINLLHLYPLKLFFKPIVLPRGRNKRHTQRIIYTLIEVKAPPLSSVIAETF